MNGLIVLLIVAVAWEGSCTPVNFPVEHQVISQKERTRQERKAEIELLINDVRSAPPEFASDCLIRIATSSLIKEPEQKRELIEAAFRLAPNVQYQNKQMGLPGSLVDTRSGYLARAFALNLDALSLRCRAVKKMISVDAQKARELFEEIPEVKLPSLTCEDSLVYDVSEFYDTLKEVAEKTFSAEEREKGEQLFFIGRRVTNLTSPVQLEPAAKAVLALKLSPSDRQQLISALSESLKKMRGDDYSFSTTVSSLTRTIGQLVDLCKREAISSDELLEGLRIYLLTHINSERCQESISAREEADYLKYFNESLRFRSPPDRGGVLPITQENIQLRKTGRIAKYSPYWQSAEARSLLVKIKHLRFGSGNTPLARNQKENPEWQMELKEFLDDLSEWRSDQEQSESDYFHQKNNIYRNLLEIVPAGLGRDRLIASYVLFLRESDLRHDSRIEWFLHAKYLIDLNRTLKGSERTKVSEALSSGGDAVLFLYATLEKALLQNQLEANRN
jgi:hypothetical protein